MKRSCPDYVTLRQRLRPLVPDASQPQASNLALFVFGLLAAWHVHLPKVALCLPMPGPLKTAQQRLERFLANPAVKAADWYEGVARALLARFEGGGVELILDQTDLGDRHPMLFVAAGYKGRALPVLWRTLPHGGCSGWGEQEPLLSAVAALLPARCRVTLLADREYGSADLIGFCRARGWSFGLRLKANRWCRLASGHAFQLREIPLRPGTVWYEDGVTLDDLPGARLSLSCGWSDRDKDGEPWYILADGRAGRDILELYRRRFRIEEMFRDFKEQGFRLEKTRLRDRERVSRLVLCVCIAYAFALLLGEQVEERGLRRWVERAAKRQVSRFQMGLRHLKRLLMTGQDWTELLALRI